MTNPTQSPVPLPEPAGYVCPTSLRMLGKLWPLGNTYPCAVVTRADAVLAADDPDKYHGEPDDPIFTTDQLRAHERAVAERCAQECERLGNRAGDADECAEAIRKLFGLTP